MYLNKIFYKDIRKTSADITFQETDRGRRRRTGFLVKQGRSVSFGSGKKVCHLLDHRFSSFLAHSLSQREVSRRERERKNTLEVVSLKFFQGGWYVC